MNYILLFSAAMCIAVQFSLAKVYQSKFSDGAKSNLFYASALALFSFLLFLVISKFKITFTVTPTLLAFGLALFFTVNNVLSIVAVKFGEVSVYTVFMMLGGMLLPYVFGIAFLSEKPSVGSIIGIFVLVAALILSVSDKLKTPSKNAKIYTLLCITVFCVNGGVSIISKVSRITADAIPVFEFLTLTYLFSFLCALLALEIFVLTYRVKKAESGKLFCVGSARGISLAIFTIIGVAIISSVGYLLQLLGAESLPSVVLYPIVSGGSIVFSSVLSRLIFKEKFSVFKSVSLILTVIGTVLFLF